jgi:alanine dehydrogenase
LNDAIRKDASLARGVNTMTGILTSRPVAEAHGLKYSALSDL